MSISFPFDEPYFTGQAATSSLVPSNFPIAIGGHPYMIDVAHYSRKTLPSVTVQQDQFNEPGEQSLNREGFWRRSQARFGMGAGQLYFDDDSHPMTSTKLDDPSDRRRFNTSKGLDPWADRSLSLLHDTELKGTVTGAANLQCFSVGGFLYVVDGANLRFTADPTLASPTWTTNAALGTITGVASDGVYVYVACTGFNLQRHPVGGGALTNFGALTPTMVWFANGRLLGATGSTLHEIDSTGAKPAGADIKADYRTAGSWTALTGAPDAIYAAFTVGTTSELYAITIEAGSTALTAPTWAAGLPTGESCNALAYYGGVVLLATSKGLRVAQTSSKRLIYGPATDIANGVRCLEPQANFCWFGWSNYDGSSTGLGRADLATNTSSTSIVPAYASDLMATTQGTVTGVCTFGTRRYFVVAGVGLFGETSTLVASGTFNSGWIRYSTLIAKLFTGVQLGHDSLVGSIGVAMKFIDGSTLSAGTSSVVGTVESSLFDASGVGVAAQVILTFNRATTTTGPTLRFWTVSALPRPRRVTEIIVPVILASKVSDLKNRQISLDPPAEFQYLDGLRSTNSLIAYQEGDVARLARVDTVSIPESMARHWSDPERGGHANQMWFDAVTAFVRVLTKED